MRVSIIALLASVSVASGFPSLLPRGHSFKLHTTPNPKHLAHGPAAKAKALLKYAHLVESTTNQFAYPAQCK